MIVVVSGLPRSGTSLMMQMLEAGGLPILMDDRRPADADNPRGYYEFQPVKTLDKDNSWMAQAEGKAVKVVSLLLYHLPPGHDYKVLFMERTIAEVLASQTAMLKRLQPTAAPPSPDLDAAMRSHFEKHLKKLDDWLPQQKHISIARFPHATVLADPTAAATNVQQFLGLPLNTAAMSAVIDKSLHRQKSAVK